MVERHDFSIIIPRTPEGLVDTTELETLCFGPASKRVNALEATDHEFDHWVKGHLTDGSIRATNRIRYRLAMVQVVRFFETLDETHFNAQREVANV